MRFVGSIEAKIDDKGRAFLPSAFRKVMEAAGEAQFVLCKDVFQSCLVLYPESVWNEQLDRLRLRLNRWNKQHRQLLRQLTRNAMPVGMDRNGRILLPKRSLGMVAIGQDILFSGMDDTIELWNPRMADEADMDVEVFAGALEQVLGQDVSVAENV